MSGFDSAIGATEISVANVRTSNRDGAGAEGFGMIRVWPSAGRGVFIEIVEELSGSRIVAEIDLGRPRRARSHLQAEQLRQALDSAARIDGIGDPFPEPIFGSCPDCGQRFPDKVDAFVHRCGEADG